MHEIVRASTDVVMTMLDRLRLSSRAGIEHLLVFLCKMPKSCEYVDIRWARISKNTSH